MKISKLNYAIISTLLTSPSYYALADDIETIEVIGHQKVTSFQTSNRSQVENPDVAEMLKKVPGAEVNRNGALTGIVQYRGLYGDRVSTKIDGQQFIGAGPNAMDTPLSYSPSIMTKSLSVYRGIAPVTAGIETLGGAVETTLSHATFNSADAIEATGQLVANYRNANNATGLAAKSNISNDKIAALIYIDSNNADDTESPNGKELSPTRYSKIQSGFDTRYQTKDTEIGLAYHYTDTHQAGTPALPMDITYIYGNRINIDGKFELAESTLSWQLGYLDAAHEMDNFTERENSNGARYRVNNADSESVDFSLVWENEQLTLGVDGYRATHDSIITNPNNDMFNVVNFNNIVDAKYSAYTQWQQELEDSTITIGARVKHILADADNVNHHMAMMNNVVMGLVNGFNSSDRDQSDTNYDLVIDWLYSMNSDTQFNLTLASKQRAPSYQERYLWLPMEATGGLADGNTYLGNPELSAETAKQINFGITHRDQQLTLTADAFYQRIDDYIQGLPSTNMPVKMFASMMMNSDNLLQFSNVEASLYGFDGQLSYEINSQWYLQTLISYVRGKREDIDDNLYRIAPLKATLALQYQTEKWAIELSANTVAKQDKVSELNQEQPTAGYSYFDITSEYQLSNAIQLQLGINNLFDKTYYNHLGGYNRVANNGFPILSRLPNEGRNLWATIKYRF